jgi:hypothetical protein
MGAIPVSFESPDTSGNVWIEPAAVNFGSNDRYPVNVVAFADTATRIGVGVRFRVPDDYTGAAAALKVEWSTPATSGLADWEFDYTAVGGDDVETFDPAGDQESAGTTDAASGTARRKQTATIALTPGNFAAGDEVLGTLFRDGSESDTIAANVYVFSAVFQYT